jgi:hypothetical protein
MHFLHGHLSYGRQIPSRNGKVRSSFLRPIFETGSLKSTSLAAYDHVAQTRAMLRPCDSLPSAVQK